MGGVRRRLPAGRAVLRQRLAALAATTALAAALALPGAAARATDYTWVGGTSSDYSTASNWSPSGGPPAAGDTAYFGTSATTSLSNSDPGSLDGWTFKAGAPAYDFTVTKNIEFDGAGIVINGGSATITNKAILNFAYSSTAGSATITNDIILQFFNFRGSV
jgi:hypothetical protein